MISKNAQSIHCVFVIQNLYNEHRRLNTQLFLFLPDEILLKCSDLANVTIEEMGTIAYALKHKKYSVAVILYLYGADPDVKEQQGFTALHHAVENKDMKAVSLLIRLGANV